MAQIGELFVRIGANTEGLKKGMGEAQSSLARLGKAAGPAILGLAKLSTGAVAAGAALGAALTKQGLAAVDAQAKLARSVGATVDGLRGVQIAADRAGVSSSVMESTAKKLNKELARAAKEGGRGADFLNELGLSAESLSAMDVDERLATMADAMHDAGLSAGEAQAAMRDLGIRSEEMALLMISGGDAIRDARGDVDAFGLSVSAVDSATIERANDRMADVARLLDTLRQRLAVGLAPVIEAVSVFLGDAAKESGGFAGSIDNAIKIGVNGFASLMNVVESFRRVIMMVVNAADVLGSGFVLVNTNIMKSIIDGPIAGLNFLIEQINRIPGINVEAIAPPALSEKLGEIATAAEARMRESQQNITELLNKPLPADGIIAAYDQAVEASRISSAAQVAEEEKRQAQLNELRLLEAENVKANGQVLTEAELEALKKRSEAMREALLTEEEAEKERHLRQLEELQLFLDEKIIKEEEYAERSSQLAKAHEDEMSKIRDKGKSEQEKLTENEQKEKSKTVESGISNIMAATSDGNRAMFEMNKVAAISEALLSMKESIVSAYAAGSKIGGPPVGAAFAAAAGAAQLANISAIKSQSFGGGGAAAPSAASAPAAAPAAQGGGGQQSAASEPSRMLTIRGANDFIRQLAEELVDFQKDGGRVVFSG